MESPISYANIARRTQAKGTHQTSNRFVPTPHPLQPLQSPTEKVKQEKPTVEDKSEDNKENVKNLELDDKSGKGSSEEDDELERQNAGPFGALTHEVLVVLAVYLGPQNVCSLGRTCRFLLKQLLNEKVWKLVSNPTSKPQISFRLESSIKKIDNPAKKDGDKKEELPPVPPNPSDIKNLLVEDYKNEALRKRLADHWMLLSLVSQAEKDSKADASKYKDDKIPVKLGGGIYIDASFSFGNKKSDRPPVKVLSTKDLSMIPVWLNGVIELLRGKTKVSLPYVNGTVTLHRVGRGGSVLKFVLNPKDPNEIKTFYFSLSKFCIEFRNAAKEYRALVGSCLKYIKYSGKDVELETDESESKAIVKSYLDRENAIKDILSPSVLDVSVKTIKNLLKSGTTGVSLAAYFKEKKEEKQRVNAQRALEYSNMYKFLLENLPEDYDEVKENAELQNKDVERRKLVDAADRKLRREQFDLQKTMQQQQKKLRVDRPERPNVMKIMGKNLLAAKEKEEEELKEMLKDPVKKVEYQKKQAEESKQRAEAKAEAEKIKAENRVRKVFEKSMDDEGFITAQTRFVKGTEEKDEEEPAKGKKQQGKKQQNKKNAKNKQKKVLEVVKHIEDDESYLASNPYAAALQQEDFESISETLYKKVMKNQPESSPVKVKGQQKGKFNQSKKKVNNNNKPKNKVNKPLKKAKQGKNQQRDTRVAPTSALGFWEANPLVFQLVLGLLLLIFIAFVYSFVISGISS